MKKWLCALCVLVALAVAPPEAGSQSRPEASPAAEPVVQELRLLRRAVERHASTAARVQLLTGRLAVQDQRVARAEDVLERFERESFRLGQERLRLEAEVRDLARALDQEPDEARRAALEQEVRRARERAHEHHSTVGRLEAGRAQARNDVSAAQARYAELEAAIDDFDRELRPGP